jgi:uncharacterized protein
VIQGYIRVSRRAWAYSTQAYQARPGEQKKLKRHLRWTILSVIREASVRGWFSFLEEPIMRPFLAANPRLAFRPMGTYMSRRWGWTKRFKVIRDTYVFVDAKGGAFREAMLREGGLLLAQIPLEKAKGLVLRMRADAQFRKEGEVGVFLEFEGIQGAISSFAFSLEHRSAGWVCYLGALQGRKGGDEDVIKLATKAMHGLRPKALMVFAAQEIARSLRVSSLLGVGNDIHVARARVIGPSRKILFDYDDLWREAGGEPHPDGWFALPLRTPRRTDEEIKANKRSMYAKRYALMDTFSRQIRTILTASQAS